MVAAARRYLRTVHDECPLTVAMTRFNPGLKVAMAASVEGHALAAEFLITDFRKPFTPKTIPTSDDLRQRLSRI